jgi:hypothetical protein
MKKIHARARGTQLQYASAPPRIGARMAGPITLGLVTLALTGLIVMFGVGTRGGDDVRVQASTGGISADGGGDKWDDLWYSFSRKNRRWAKRTGECESGNNPTAHGGGGIYHGAFQYLKSTWNDAPKSPDGDPHNYRWRIQAVVSILKKKRDGTGAWPVCG